jgi:hypothetical protein
VKEPTWRKSSRSGSGAEGGQDCVEVADLNGTRGIRDSKAPEAGHVALNPAAFAALVDRIKRDEYTA